MNRSNVVSSRVARLSLLTTMVAALAACGGGNDEAPQATPAPPVATPAPPAAGTPPAPPPTTPAPPPAGTPPAPPPASPAPPPAGSTYTVGGTVTGLDGSVTLSKNGAAPITVSASGSFTFNDPAATGSTYSVAIASLPSKQNCVLTNAQGTVTTANVVSVGVACTTRAWTAGSPLEVGDVPVVLMDAGMDQEGRVITVFVKSDGTTANLFATRGTPGAAGAAVQWSTPVRIDADTAAFNDPASFKSNHLSLAVSPAGAAHAVWVSNGPCTSQTWRTNSGFVCKYLYSSTYAPATNTWSAPVLIGDTPGGSSNGNTLFRPTALINDRGDVAVEYGGYIQSSPPVSASFGTVRQAMAWRSAGQSAFTLRAFQDIPAPADTRQFATLDNSGGMVVVAERTQSASTNEDVISYSGSVASGFADTTGTVVDTLGNNADLRAVTVGPTGAVLVTWRQNDTTASRIFAATKANAAAAWSAPEVVASSSSLTGTGLVTTTGESRFYASCIAYLRSGTAGAAGTWAARNPGLPSNCGFDDDRSRLALDGSFLQMATNGLWNTYSQADNSVSRLASATPAGPDYLLGFARTWATQSKLLFTKTPSGNYIGAHIARAEFDTLPTPTATSGDGRNNVINLWGHYLK